MEASRNKQFISFNLCARLSSMMKPRTVLLRLSQDVDHPFAQSLHAACAAYTSLGSCPGITACVQVTLILLDNGPKTQGMCQKEAVKCFL